MVLEARFQRGSATQNRLTPLIPPKGDILSYHRCEYGKLPLRGAGGIQKEGRLMQ
jgi:hypothetical protein